MTEPRTEITKIGWANDDGDSGTKIILTWNHGLTSSLR